MLSTVAFIAFTLLIVVFSVGAITANYLRHKARAAKVPAPEQQQEGVPEQKASPEEPSGASVRQVA